MSDKKIFLAGDHNHPGGVWAVDVDHWDWMIFNGCSPYVLSKEEAQKLLTEGGMGVDFGEEDNRWNYHPYSPLGDSTIEELSRDWAKDWDYWNGVRNRLETALHERGW